MEPVEELEPVFDEPLPTYEEPEVEQEEKSSSSPSRKEKAKAMAEKAKTFIEQEEQNGEMQKFLKFCADFGKSYINQSEFKMRLWNWRQSEKYIKENSWDKREHYKLAHNKFSDYSEKEFSKLLGYALPAEKKAKNIARMPNSANIADSIDWT